MAGNDPEFVHTVVIGAGPGGLQAAYCMQQQGQEYVVLEADEKAGQFFTKFPRHRTLISISKKHNYFPEKDFNMRHDWNSLLTDDFSHLMTDYTEELFPAADQLVEYLEDFHTKFQLNVRFGTRVTLVTRAEGDAADDGAAHYRIHLASGACITCAALLIGTGVSSASVPDIPGIEHAETYEEHSTDRKLYTNKTVLVIGGGNSGFETANHLAAHAGIIHVAERRPVRHAWDTHFVGDLRAVNNNFIDLYQLKSLHATLGDPPSRIEKTKDGKFEVSFLEYAGRVDIAVGSVTLKRIYDHVITCTGVKWVNLSLFDDDCKPEVHTEGKYPVLSSAWEVTGQPHMYFVGGSMQAIDRKAASGFIHGFRYNVRSLTYLLNERYHAAPLPHDDIAVELDAIVSHVTDRLTVVSSLFQCFGVLCDVLVVRDGIAHLYRDLPRAYVKEERSDLLGDGFAFIITLQFGFPRYDGSRSANDFIQDSGTLNTKCGAFLHPVVEVYENGNRKEEFHLFETLDLRFNTDHKKTQSLSTLNQVLLKDQLNHFLRLLPDATWDEIPPLRLLTSPDTPADEKKELFQKYLPVDEVWSEEMLTRWKTECRDSEVRSKEHVECTLRPLPISQWPQ